MTASIYTKIRAIHIRSTRPTLYFPSMFHLFTPRLAVYGLPGTHSLLSTVPAALGVTLLLVACGQSTPPAGPGGAGAAPPLAQVGVVTVQTGDVGWVTELPGRLEASRTAQVRARAAGIVQKRLFVEGSTVRCRASVIPDRCQPLPGYAGQRAGFDCQG